MFNQGTLIRNSVGLNTRDMFEIIKILVNSEFSVSFILVGEKNGSDFGGYMREERPGLQNDFSDSSE